MRVKHWVKNTFIFLPLFFAGRITELDLLLNAFIIFIAFSLAASSIYILNDWKDIAQDRLHPTKKNRPLASGTINTKPAIIFAMLLLILSFSISIFVLKDFWATIILSIYVLQNTLYTFKLKNISIVDITLIAIGFVLRVFIGGVVTGIDPSQWIILMTFLLALFLALAKRRDGLMLGGRSLENYRQSLYGYSIQFIDSTLSIAAAVVILAYLMYSLSPEITQRLGNYVYLTTFFVILGILQYLKLTQVMNQGGSPVKMLFSNLFLQLIVLGWVCSYIFLIYIAK